MADDKSRAGTGYATPEVLLYVERVHARHDDALSRAFNTPGAHGLPAIQVAPSEGRLLELLVRLAGASKVLEIGTLAGYSAIRMARGLGQGGRLWTVENDPKHHALATQNIANAGLAGCVTCVLGAALEQLPALVERAPFDVIFIDADKGNYDQYGRFAAEHLRSGGLLLGDNAFFFGKLLADSAEAQAMRRFHEEAARSFDTVCVPTPDGLLIGIKR